MYPIRILLIIPYNSHVFGFNPPFYMVVPLNYREMIATRGETWVMFTMLNLHSKGIIWGLGSKPGI
jgi:hypothetical protein